MTMLGYDSTHALDHDALRARGAVAVGRYLDNPSGHADDWKALTTAEHDGYRLAGFGTFYAWETTATRALDGYDAGLKDGQRARQVMRLLGVPDTIPAIATCDTSAAPGRTVAYGRGFKAGAGTIGIYGSAGVIDAWHNDGLIGDRHGWQTNAAGWDSPRRSSPHASIHQRLHVDLPHLGNIDPDDIDDDTPLIWWTHQATPPVQEDTFMPKLTDDEQADLYTKVKELHADYAVSREANTNGPKDRGSKRWQLGVIFETVKDLRALLPKRG